MPSACTTNFLATLGVWASPFVIGHISQFQKRIKNNTNAKAKVWWFLLSNDRFSPYNTFI